MKKNIFLILIIVVALAVVGCAPAEEVVEQETEATTEQAEEVAIHISDSDYHDIIDNTEGVVIVDFWAEWCGPCVVLGPILEELSAEEGIPLYKVDVDDNPVLSKEFGITGIPMVYIYKDGEVVDSLMGLGGKDNYLNIIDKYRD